MSEEFKHDLSLLSKSAQHISRYSCSLHTRTSYNTVVRMMRMMRMMGWW